MEAKAKLNHLRISPRKVRLVLNLVRGLKVSEAQAQLSLLNKKSSEPVLKLVNSVLANAENNFSLKKDNLYIKEIFADEGPTLKRSRPRAFGRANPIRKRTTHVNITLGEIVESKDKKVDAKGKEIKDEIRKVASLDEIKRDINDDKKSEGKDSGEKTKTVKPEKGFAKKVFQRKSV